MIIEYCKDSFIKQVYCRLHLQIDRWKYMHVVESKCIVYMLSVASRVPTYAYVG